MISSLTSVTMTILWWTYSENEAITYNSENIDDDHEGDWQNQEIKKLQKRVSDLLSENVDLQRKLQKSNYDQVYKENKML